MILKISKHCGSFTDHTHQYAHASHVGNLFAMQDSARTHSGYEKVIVEIILPIFLLSLLRNFVGYRIADVVRAFERSFCISLYCTRQLVNEF